MTNQTNWTKFDGSDEQIAEMEGCEYGYLLKIDGSEYGKACPIVHRLFEWKLHDQKRITHYWIIPDDPLREMKIRWAQTGQLVWIKVPYIPATRINMDGLHCDDKFCYYHTTTPDWSIPNAEYSFTPWED